MPVECSALHMRRPIVYSDGTAPVTFAVARCSRNPTSRAAIERRGAIALTTAGYTSRPPSIPPPDGTRSSSKPSTASAHTLT